jgi:hypothetical protein
MTVENGALIISFACFILGLFYRKIKNKRLGIFLFIFTPLAISNLIYWGPKLEKIYDPEYQAWALIILAGFIGCGGIGSFLAFNIGYLNKFIKRIYSFLRSNRANKII